MTVNLGAYTIEMQIYTLLKKQWIPGVGVGRRQTFFFVYYKKKTLTEKTDTFTWWCIQFIQVYQLRPLNVSEKKKTKPIYIKIKTFLIHKLNILYFYDALQNAFVFFLIWLPRTCFSPNSKWSIIFFNSTRLLTFWSNDQKKTKFDLLVCVKDLIFESISL